MSHLSHVTYVYHVTYGSCHIGVMSQRIQIAYESCHAWYTQLSHVTYAYRGCHQYRTALPHMRHVKSESCHI